MNRNFSRLAVAKSLHQVSNPEKNAANFSTVYHRVSGQTDLARISPAFIFIYFYFTKRLGLQLTRETGMETDVREISGDLSDMLMLREEDEGTYNRFPAGVYKKSRSTENGIVALSHRR